MATKKTEADKGYINPFCKWVGSKRGLRDVIVPLIGEVKGTYYEPMVGGGAIFFALAGQEKLHGKVLLSDVNRDLLSVYDCLLQGRCGELISLLSSWEGLYRNVHGGEAYYYGMRKRVPEGPWPFIERAARFLFLNRTCFNGLYRINKKGEFNTPWGKKQDVKICHEDELRAAASALRMRGLMTVESSIFHFPTSNLSDKDVVYIDPPYIPVSKTANFTAYAGAFGMKEQERLANLFRLLTRTGARVILSNSDTPTTRALYEGCTLMEVQARRAVNSDGAKRGKVGELLVLGNVEAPNAKVAP